MFIIIKIKKMATRLFFNSMRFEAKLLLVKKGLWRYM
jgi:hypothetical protein